MHLEARRGGDEVKFSVDILGLNIFNDIRGKKTNKTTTKQTNKQKTPPPTTKNKTKNNNNKTAKESGF